MSVISVRQSLIDRIGIPVHQGSVRAGGISTTYLAAGGGPPVVLLHGGAGGAVTWVPIIKPLAERFQVIAPDVVGYGESDKPPAPYDKAFFAGWLRGFLDAMSLDRPHLVGASLGGIIAIMFLHGQPERAERLVLACPEGLGKGIPVLPQLYFVLLNTVPSLRVVRWLAPYLVHDPSRIDDAFARYVVEVCKKPGGTRPIWQGQGKVIKPVGAEVLRGIAQPTLIIWGRENQFVPVADGEAAARLIPDGRLKIIANAGHLPFLEQPEAFNALLIPFLERKDGT